MKILKSFLTFCLLILLNFYLFASVESHARGKLQYVCSENDSKDVYINNQNADDRDMVYAFTLSNGSNCQKVTERLNTVALANDDVMICYQNKMIITNTFQLAQNLKNLDPIREFTDRFEFKCPRMSKQFQVHFSPFRFFSTPEAERAKLIEHQKSFIEFIQTQSPENF